MRCFGVWSKRHEAAKKTRREGSEKKERKKEENEPTKKGDVGKSLHCEQLKIHDAAPRGEQWTLTSLRGYTCGATLVCATSHRQTTPRSVLRFTAACSISKRPPDRK